MLEVTVVSGRIDDLEQALSRAQIPGLHCRYFASPEQLDDAALAAPIALGAPDVLAPVLTRMPQLEWVQSTWAGVAPFIDAPRRDYTLTGVKGIFGASMSEYALGWMLAFERSILAHAAARSWEWRSDRSLADLRMGIAGTGSIGAEVAARCAPFLGEIVGLNSDGREVAGFARCYSMQDRALFAAGLDVLLMLLPDTQQSTRLVDPELLATMNSGSLLINAGRANSLDHEAVLAALEQGQLRAAVLDVFHEEPLPENHPYWSVEGLYITSHSSAPTRMTSIVQVFRDNLERYRNGQPLCGIVDFASGY